MIIHKQKQLNGQLTIKEAKINSVDDIEVLREEVFDENLLKQLGKTVHES